MSKAASALMQKPRIWAWPSMTLVCSTFSRWEHFPVLTNRMHVARGGGLTFMTALRASMINAPNHDTHVLLSNTCIGFIHRTGKSFVLTLRSPNRVLLPAQDCVVLWCIVSYCDVLCPLRMICLVLPWSRIFFCNNYVPLGMVESYIVVKGLYPLLKILETWQHCSKIVVTQ